jgi:hypothetical protein
MRLLKSNQQPLIACQVMGLKMAYFNFLGILCASFRLFWVSFRLTLVLKIGLNMFLPHVV